MSKEVEIKWTIGDNDRNEVEIYTDGSGINEKIGSAYVVYQNHKIIKEYTMKLNDTASVY